jgi:hypothetical protein
MPNPVVIAATRNNGSFTSGTSVTVPSTGSVTAGNLQIISIQINGATAPTGITESGWTTVMGTTVTGSGGSVSAAIFARAATVTGALSQSVSWTTTATLGQWAVFEVFGAGPLLIDGSSVSQQNATSTTPPAPTITPGTGNVNDLLICMLFANTFTSTSTPSSPAGMSTILNFTGSTTQLLFGSASLALASASATGAKNFGLTATKTTLGASFLIQQGPMWGWDMQGAVQMGGLLRRGSGGSPR